MEKMSFLPFLRDMELSRQLNDQNFGVPPFPGDIFTFANPAIRATERERLRKLRMFRDLILSGPITEVDKEKFQISLDVKDFDVEDITVKTGDGYLVVEARHEEKPDSHGSVARHFLRRISLPDPCDLDAVESTLSSDGVLTVTVPLIRLAGNERVVPITRTGPVKKLRKVVKSDREDAAHGNAKPSNAEPGDAEPADSAEPSDSAEADKNGSGAGE